MVQNRFPETVSLWSVRIVSYSRFFGKCRSVLWIRTSICFHFCENPDSRDKDLVQNRLRKADLPPDRNRGGDERIGLASLLAKSGFGGFLEASGTSPARLDWFSREPVWRCISHLRRTNLFLFVLLPVHMLIRLYTNFGGIPMRQIGQTVL